MTKHTCSLNFHEIDELNVVVPESTEYNRFGVDLQAIGRTGAKSGSVVATLRIMSTMERITETLKEGGPSLLLFRICHKLASPVLDFGSTIFFSIDPGIAETHPRQRSNFLCCLAHPADAIHLVKASDPSRTLDQVNERFRQGQICFAAVNSEGRIVHTRWCATARANIGELGRDIQPSPGEVYVYDSYTRPEFRGLGASSELQVFIMDTLAAAGVSRIHAFVKGDNISVLRAVKPPHRKTGKLYYFRFPGFTPIIIGRRIREFPLLVIPGKEHRSAEAFQSHR